MAHSRRYASSNSGRSSPPMPRARWDLPRPFSRQPRSFYPDFLDVGARARREPDVLLDDALEKGRLQPRIAVALAYEVVDAFLLLARIVGERIEERNRPKAARDCLARVRAVATVLHIPKELQAAAMLAAGMPRQSTLGYSMRAYCEYVGITTAAASSSSTAVTHVRRRIFVLIL